MSLVTPRDRALFQELAKYGMLSTSQLSRKVFPGVQNSTVLRRLRALEDAKWIYRVKALDTGELVWILSRRGEAEIGSRASMIKPNRNSVTHDVLLTDLRLTFDSIGLGQNFMPEWEIRRRTFERSRNENAQPIVPDGIFTSPIWNERIMTVALELEIQGKNVARYEKIFSKYMDHSHLDLVWYFVRRQSFGESLRAKWNEAERGRLRKDQHFLFTAIDEFRANPRKALIHFQNGQTNSIEVFFKLSAPAQVAAQPLGGLTKPKNNEETEQIAS